MKHSTAFTFGMAVVAGLLVYVLNRDVNGAMLVGIIGFFGANVILSMVSMVRTFDY